MENFLIMVVAIVYAVWSIRWGVRFVHGRWVYLERPNRKWLKVLVSIAIGLVFGLFYIIFRALKFIFSDFPRMMSQ